MAQAIRSILIRCSVLCRITVGRPLRTLSRRPALQLMQAIPTSLLPLLTISEALLSFAYLEAGSISVQSRHSRNARVRLQDRGQRLRAKPQRAECKDCHWLIWHWTSPLLRAQAGLFELRHFPFISSGKVFCAQARRRNQREISGFLFYSLLIVLTFVGALIHKQRDPDPRAQERFQRTIAAILFVRLRWPTCS